jgi:hypothetical protein
MSSDSDANLMLDDKRFMRQLEDEILRLQA